jgi:DNA-binding LacI/PurR family transcriptional regulator
MVMTFSTQYETKKEVEYIKTCSQFNFAGLMLITSQSGDVFDAIQMIDRPIVMVNRTLENYNCDVVSMDNFQAGYMATKHLIELGHHSIAFLWGGRNLSSINQRFQGYRQVLKNYQISFSKDHVFYGNLNLDSGYEISKIYGKNIQHLPSAVVVSNDLTAIGFIDGLGKQGISIPDMLSVVSFDDIMFSALHNINMTTISQQSIEISRHATRLILRRIKDPDAKPEKIILEPNLIIRGTTARYNPNRNL